MGLIENLNLINSYKSDISAAIEAKGVTMTSVPLSEYASKIGEIQTLPTLEALSVSTNGTYTPGAGVDGFSQVDVDVQPELQNKTVIENGEYTADQGYYGLGTVTVSVPSPQFVTETLSVSINGTYTPGVGVDGYSQVVVDVPQSVTGFTEKDLTEGRVNIVNLNNTASFVAAAAFTGNKTIETVNLSYCLNVGSEAFNNCTSLQTVSLPICEKIDNLAFNSCSKIQNIELSQCSYIGDYAFQRCSSLQAVSLPVCKFAGAGAFRSCYALQSIELPLCYNIGNNAFNSCSSLSQMSFPNVVTIENTALTRTAISSIYLPKCYSIGIWAMNDCKSLLEIDLPILEKAGGMFIEGCTSLTTIYLCSETYTIPTYFLSTTNIGVVTSIYTHVDNVSRFAVENGWSSVSSLFIGIGDPTKPMLSYSDGVLTGYTKLINKSFAYYLGISNSNITSVNLSDCKIVGSEAFNNCTSLQTVSLPVCELIASSGFKNCNMLSSLDLPVCSNIFYDAFLYCTPLNTLILRSNTVCDLSGYNAFFGTSIYNGQGSIYVPASLVDVYKTHRTWGYFSSQIFAIPE